MKIVNIVPGFGGTFYCGNCLRDSAFTASLRESGHDAVVLPMYLPLTSHSQKHESDYPVFYGAVNIYLRQSVPFLRNMPGWMEKLFDSAPMLNLAAKKSGSTRAQGLEKLTESMLLGEHGNQHHELDHLVEFLKNHAKPDIVHFSNALLLGLARRIRNELKIPVVCSLQDEDVWVDAMAPEWQQRIWDLMAERGRDVDAFVAVSDFFAAVMKEKMNIPQEKLHVVPIGIRPDRYTPVEPARSPMAIGYLSRLCEENGFGLLVDAFILLKEDIRFAGLELIATGGMTGDDRPFLKAQMKKLEKKNLSGQVHITPDFTPDALESFFRRITVMSVPVLKGEAFGLYQLEALASGIPIVQPMLGAFPEVVRATGGGRLYTPNTPGTLAGCLGEVLSDPLELQRMSHAGRRAIEDIYDSRILTSRMLKIYKILFRAV